MDFNLLRTLGKTLAKTEWLPWSELQAYRAPLVTMLFTHARQTTAFYRNRLDFDVSSLESIEKNWSNIPILTRAEAVANRESLRSRKPLPESFGVEKVETSGSTGIPFSYEGSGASTAATVALSERMFRWWSVDGTRSLALIGADKKNVAPPPKGSASLGWHPKHPTGIRYFLTSVADIDSQLRWLLARKPAYLFAYSTVLRELAPRSGAASGWSSS